MREQMRLNEGAAGWASFYARSLRARKMKTPEPGPPRHALITYSSFELVVVNCQKTGPAHDQKTPNHRHPRKPPRTRPNRDNQKFADHAPPAPDCKNFRHHHSG